jgi:type I restriction enzyme R subunit
VLTHYAARAKTAPPMMLRDGGATKLEPVSAAGSGNVNERERVALREVVEKLNNVFGGDLTDGDQLSYVKTLLAKLMESSRLATQAANNLKEQFAASPDLHNELVDAVIGSFDAHGAMSKQMLSSKEVQSSVLALLLDHFGLWEALREKAA